MNTLKIFLLGILSTFLVACKDDDKSNNGLKTGQIEFKAYPNEYDYKISFNAAVHQKITINWGNGVKEEYFGNGDLVEYSHKFANLNLQTITIEAESSITKFTFNADLPYVLGHIFDGYISEIKFGKVPDLREIYVLGG